MSGSAGAPLPEEDVSQLSFGAFDSASWLPNSHVSLLLAEIAAKRYGGSGGGAEGRPPPEVFTKAREYATRFVGAVEVTDVAAIDELFSSLRALEWAREGSAAGAAAPPARLHEYQILAFSNLNPGSVAAARALIPKLEPFSDEEIAEVLTLLRRTAARSQVGIADLLGGSGGVPA